MPGLWHLFHYSSYVSSSAMSTPAVLMLPIIGFRLVNNRYLRDNWSFIIIVAVAAPFGTAFIAWMTCRNFLCILIGGLR